MANYRRVYQSGGCYFFTVVTYKRQPLLSSEVAIARLRQSFLYARKKLPFEIDSIVILPDHLHCIWQLPMGDDDFSERWRFIKYYFSVGMKADQNHRREKSIWQRRFWEHLIRDENDWRHHMDYIYYNPVKHGYVSRPIDWPYSSFKRDVGKGLYSADWGIQISSEIIKLDFE